MNKLVALLAVFCIATHVSCQGPPNPGPNPNPGPPAQGSVAQIVNTCLQANFNPNDQAHRQFGGQVSTSCGNPPPSGQVQPFADQITFLNGAISCVQNIQGDATSKSQFIASLNCAISQVNANKAASGSAQMFTQKRKPSIAKKLRK